MEILAGEITQPVYPSTFTTTAGPGVASVGAGVGTTHGSGTAGVGEDMATVGAGTIPGDGTAGAGADTPGAGDILDGVMQATAGVAIMATEDLITIEDIITVDMVTPITEVEEVM